MNKPQIEPFGSWKSPITSESIVSQTIGIGSIAVEGNDIYWLEKRPTEKGRNAIARYDAIEDKIEDVTPKAFSVRTKVHEYGGAAFLIVDETIYFSNYSDGRIYQQTLRGKPQALTPESSRRYADLVLDCLRNHLICVCEEHFPKTEAVNTIVTINLTTGEVANLIAGQDFYSSPRISPDGKQLAWLSWSHPQMPWDSTYLWVAEIEEDGSLTQAKCIAGGQEESICEPKWSDEGELYFSSDRNNWWNLYRYRDGEVEILHEMAAEFAYPHWVFGLSTYDFLGDRIICTYSADGCWYLGSIDLNYQEFHKIETNYTNISDLKTTNDGHVVFVGGSPTEITAVVKLNPDTREERILKSTGNLDIDLGYLSQPEAIAFPTSNNLTAYAWYYPPQNQDYVAPKGELPPLIVKSHGGPTAAASVDLNLRIQYWTSRGFGYLDVNYGGSIGYGRQYRQRLDGKWGIVDVDDCVNGAKYLVERGTVDGERLVITGSSAGGYTTLAALTFRDTFKAGASYYGVCDLEVLAQDTHKFESRYLDRLIGKYPEDKDLYQARSPIDHAEQLNCPVIFFQGLEDRVVPPNQAEMMFNAIKQKGLPVASVVFPEEAHGFRQAKNIKKALDSEFYFYSRIFDFEPADEIEPIPIINLGG
jgi:dipeptidyl aminopeptidase/acylaminoacyl peptidase